MEGRCFLSQRSVACFLAFRREPSTSPVSVLGAPAVWLAGSCWSELREKNKEKAQGCWTSQSVVYSLFAPSARLFSICNCYTQRRVHGSKLADGPAPPVLMCSEQGAGLKERSVLSRCRPDREGLCSFFALRYSFSVSTRGPPPSEGAAALWARGRWYVEEKDGGQLQAACSTGRFSRLFTWL